MSKTIIQFTVIGNQKAEREIKAIKKIGSTYKKAVVLNSSNGFYETDEKTWQYIKERFPDACYVGEV